VESSEVGRDIPRIFSGQEKQKQILPGEKVRAKELPIVSYSFSYYYLAVAPAFWPPGPRPFSGRAF
jgi:hypothetical protein